MYYDAEDLYEAIERYNDLENGNCEDEFEQILNEDYEDIVLLGCTYKYGYVLKSVATVAFDNAYNDWANDEMNELWDEYEFDEIKDWNPYDVYFTELTEEQLEEYVKFRDIE
jgi:hypothetical protein